MAVSLWVTDYAVSQRKASVRALNRWLTTSHTQQQIFRWMICAKTWPKDQTHLGLEGFKPGVCFQMRPCWERFPSLLTHLTQRRTGTKCILPLQTLTESYYLVLSEVHSVCYYCPVYHTEPPKCVRPATHLITDALTATLVSLHLCTHSTGKPWEQDIPAVQPVPGRMRHC